MCVREVSCEVFNFLQLRGYEKEGKLYLPCMKISGTYLIYLYLH